MPNWLARITRILARNSTIMSHDSTLISDSCHDHPFNFNLLVLLTQCSTVTSNSNTTLLSTLLTNFLVSKLVLNLKFYHSFIGNSLVLNVEFETVQFELLIFNTLA